MGALVLFAYIAVPVLEIATVIWVAGMIGGWWTLAALLGCSLLGAVLVSRGGRRTLASFQEAVAAQRQPDDQLVKGSLVFMGGVMLLVPGFLSSVVGVLWALPLTRPLTRRWLARAMDRRAKRYAEAMRAAQERGGGPFGGPPGGPGAGPTGGGPGSGTGSVVQGDVLNSRDSRTTGLPPDADESSR